MGLFDYVDVECELPKLVNCSKCLQTKDLGCSMEDYRITKDGRLERSIYHTEDRSDPTASGLMSIAGCMTHVHERWEDMNYHGCLELTGFESPGTADQKLIVFKVKFTDGKIIKIERIEDN